MSTRQDRLEVLFDQALMVSSEHKDSLRCAYELLDWETQCTVHTSTLQTIRDKDSVSKEPGVQINCRLGRRMRSDSQHSGLSPSTSATRQRCLDQAAAVIGRGFAHSERRPQLKHTYSSMTRPVSRSMAFSTRRVPWYFANRMMWSLYISSRLPRIASGRLLARPPVRTDWTLGLSLESRISKF